MAWGFWEGEASLIRVDLNRKYVTPEATDSPFRRCGKSLPEDGASPAHLT